MTLQALRNRVGDLVFWRIVRTWIREQGGGNGCDRGVRGRGRPGQR